MNPTQPERICVCIPTRNRPVSLRRTLEVLRWQTRPPDEIVVVDDSDDDSHSQNASDLQRLWPRATHVRKAVPGLPASRNLGVEHATAETVLFIDDDVILHPAFLERIARAFRDPNVMGAGGVIVDQRSMRWRLVRSLVGLDSWRDGRVTASGWPSALPTKSGPTQYLSGCNMAFRREVLIENPFDENFVGYALGEDLEYTFRLHRMGRELRIVGDAFLWHLDSPKQPTEDFGYQQVVIRPKVAGSSFSRWRFFTASMALTVLNRFRAPELARGNIRAIRHLRK